MVNGWPTNWRDAALCRPHDTAVWFAEEDTNPELVAEAKRVCARCPVAVPCLVESVHHGEEFGIFAGANEKTRRWLRWELDSPDTDPAAPVLPIRHDDPFSVAVARHLHTLNRKALGAVDNAAAELALPWGRPVPNLVELQDQEAGSTSSTCARCGEPTRPGDVIDRNGPNAECGHASTYANGCRCLPCERAQADRKAEAHRRPPVELAGQLAITSLLPHSKATP